MDKNYEEKPSQDSAETMQTIQDTAETQPQSQSREVGANAEGSAETHSKPVDSNEVVAGQPKPQGSSEGVPGQKSSARDEKLGPEDRTAETSPQHEPDLMDIVQRYAEQPTMEGEKGEPKQSKRRIRAKPKRERHRDLNQDTVFENVGDETKEEEEKKRRKEEKTRLTKGSVDMAEKEDDGAYENLPTPPDEATDRA
ncbi:hypothetical protein GCK32_009192, partial [Trichostrongylus colubriformis]